MARLHEGLGRDDYTLGYTYLQASWEEEENAGYLEEDLKRSLRYFEKYLIQPGPTDTDALHTALLVKGELIRRLGRFDDSRRYFTNLKKRVGFRSGYNSKVIRYQLKLCKIEDAGPHVAPENKPGFFSRCKSFWGGLGSRPKSDIEVRDAVSIPEGAVIHTIYPGETLDDVSRQYGISKDAIMQQNELKDEASVVEGLRLWIPEKDQQ